MNQVYMLACRDHSLYTGWTNALDKRIREHTSGKGAKYTRSRLPLRLVYQEVCATAAAARKREAALKRMSRREKLLLIERYDKLLALARQQLNARQIQLERLWFIQEKAGIAVFYLEADGYRAILKLFSADDDKRPLAAATDGASQLILQEEFLENGEQVSEGLLSDVSYEKIKTLFERP